MTRSYRPLITWIVLTAVAIGGGTFCLKLYEFIRTANEGSLPGFAFATVFSYFIATAGFLCLAVWAYLKGHYHDLEEPKFRLLQNEDELDRREAAGKAASARGGR